MKQWKKGENYYYHKVGVVITNYEALDERLILRLKVTKDKLYLKYQKKIPLVLWLRSLNYG